jgi:hypothetical protein
MPRPIEIPVNGRGSELPDFFQDLAFHIGHTVVPNSNNTVLLYFAERPVVIDSCTYGVATTDGITCQLIYVSDPANTTGTAVHATPSSMSATGTIRPTIDIDNNLVPAGSWLLAKFSGNANTLHVGIHIRYRTRQA